MSQNGKVAMVVGAGDYIGSAIAKHFARGGFTVVAAWRNKTGDKLAPLRRAIEFEGGVCHAMTVDARREEQVVELFEKTESDIGPIEVCVFNVGGNVHFPLLETTSRVFCTVWEMACFAGFLTAREAGPATCDPGGVAPWRSPVPPRACAVPPDTRRLPAPSRGCAHWRRAVPTNSARRTFTSATS